MRSEILLRHSFSNPLWWTYQWSLVWYHGKNGVLY
jgi:hypothetical protein